MNKQSFFTTVPVIALATMVNLYAQETTYTGSITAKAGVSLANAHNHENDFTLGQTIFDGSFKTYFDEAMVYVNGQLVHDAIGSQSSNGMSGFVANDGSFALKLKEAYIDWKSGMFALRIGRQIVSWGKADDFQITDVVSPFDESNVVAYDYNEAKLGVDAARLSLLTDKAQVDAYYIPFFTPSILPFAKKNPLRSKIFPEKYNEFKLQYPESHEDLELPRKNLNNSEYALRASFYTSVMDLSLYAFYGWDDKPFIKYTPMTSEDIEFNELYHDGFNVSGKYKRMSMVGADAAIPVGDFVFRLEAAYFPNRHIQTTPEYQFDLFTSNKNIQSSKRNDQFLSLAGVDWTFTFPYIGTWTVTAQYISDIVFKYRIYLDRKQYEHQVAGSVEKSLLNETLTISASGALDLCLCSSSSEIAIDYRLTDAITISMIGDLFLKGSEGKDGTYGIYRDFSGITFKGKVMF